jgi:hypothetical protein
MRQSILAALALTLLSGSAAAADLSFNNLTVGYEQLDFDCSSDCDGFGIAASAELSGLFFISGSASRYEDSLSAYSATFGIRTGGTRFAWYGELGLSRASVSANSVRLSEKELVLIGGIRGLVNPNLEIDASIGYSNADDRLAISRTLKSDPTIAMTGTWFLTDTVGASLSLSGNGDLFGGGIGLRVNF